MIDGNTSRDGSGYGHVTIATIKRSESGVNGNAVHQTRRDLCGSDSSSGYRLEALIGGNDVHDNTGRDMLCNALRATSTAEIRGNLVYDNAGVRGSFASGPTPMP